MIGYLQTRDGDICKYQYRYHTDTFFTAIYLYDIDISHPLKPVNFQFFMKNMHLLPENIEKIMVPSLT